MLSSSSASVCPKRPRNRPVSVAIASSWMTRAAEWGTSWAVNSPQSRWKGTPWRSRNTHWVPSGLAISHSVARPGCREPSKRSVCTSGSAKGRTWAFAEVVVPSQPRTSSWTGGVTAMRRRPPTAAVCWAAEGVLVGRGVAVATTVGAGVAAAGAVCPDAAAAGG